METYTESFENEAGFWNPANVFTFIRVPLAVFGLVIIWVNPDQESLLIPMIGYAVVMLCLFWAYAILTGGSEVRITRAIIVPSAILFAAVLPIICWATTGNTRLTGIVIVMVAAWTDFFDGVVARQTNSVTRLGAILDPVADKLLMGLTLVFAIFYFLSERADLIGWLIALAATELAIMIYTAYVIKTRRQEMQVNWFGKKGMFGRMTGVTWLMTSTFGTGWFFTASAWMAYGFSVAGVIFGLVALVQYVGQARNMPKVS